MTLTKFKKISSAGEAPERSGQKHRPDGENHALNPMWSHLAKNGLPRSADCLQRNKPSIDGPVKQCKPAHTAPVNGANGAQSADQTGLPGVLRSGLESLSGLDLSATRVHGNSSEPARVNALAYTQGHNIFVGPGQEKHIPHEGWHVVQQMQGRVKPTIQAKEEALNDDKGLEREADVMGAKALNLNVPEHRATSHQAAGFNSSQQPIQRRLIATGSDIGAFVDMASPASGLALEHDPLSNQINAIGSLPAANSSASFNAILSNIMDDPAQDAEINFGRHQARIGIGGFPSGGATFQRVDMDDIEAVEATAPGNGIGKLAHEIQENYIGHAGAPVAGMAPFGPSHQAGVAAESLVTNELVGPGDRVAGVTDHLSATEQTVVQDFDNYYFLYTLTRTPPSDFEVTSAIQAGKRVISTDVTDNFAVGSAALPASAAGAIATAVATIAATSDATVRIKGYTDSDGKAVDNTALSQNRATAVQTSLVAAGVSSGRTYTQGLGDIDPVTSNATEAGKAQNRRVEIDVTQPDPTTGPMSSSP